MKRAFVLLHISVFLAGFTGIFGKLITLPEGLLVWYRMLFAAILLLVILKSTRKYITYDKRSTLIMMASGMLPMLHWIFFYGSIKYSNVSVGVVCYSLTGFFTAVFAPIFSRRRVIVSELCLSAITLCGIGLIFHFDTSFRTGIGMGVVSSMFAAFFFIANEALVKRYNNQMINFYQMTGGTISLGLLLPLYLHYFPSAQLIPSPLDAVYLFLLALVCTIALYGMITEVLRKISAFTVNLSFNLEPVYSILLAILLFKENKELNASFYGGLFLIVLSVVLQMVLLRRRAIATAVHQPQ